MARSQSGTLTEVASPQPRPSQGAVGGRKELRALAAKANVPVTTTLHAMGVFDEEDPLSLHMLGMHGSAYANFAIQARSIPACSIVYREGGCTAQHTRT